MEKEHIVILDDRGLISISGEDTRDFLQNILSNDINKVNQSNSIFSGIFTPQGKYLYEFFIIKSENGYLIDCDNEFTNEIIDHLSKYKIRSKVKISDLSSKYVMGIISLEKFKEIQKNENNDSETILFRDSSVFIDSRSKILGARILSSLEKLYLTIKKMNLKIVDIKNYTSIAHLNGIPIKGLRNLQDKLFGLEANFEELKAIDFKKGCYIGQENTARMKLKNKIRRRLIPIESKEELTINTEITFKNKIIGTVLISGINAFALLKLFEPNFSEYEKDQLLSNKKKLKVIRPFFL